MSSPHRFVVRQQVYTPPDAAGVRRVLPEKHDRVATFPKAEQAYADCAKRLAEFRRTTNPFQLGGPCLFYQTNLPAFAFHDYLLDHDLTPPQTSLTANPNYVFWWVKNNRAFTDRDREVVWTACDKLKPFDVIEEDDRKAVFVVVELACGYWYDYFEPAREGGYLHFAFATRKAARRERDEQHAEIGNRSSLNGMTVFASDGDYRTADEMESFAEVATVPCLEPVIGQFAHFVVRQSYATEAGGYAHQATTSRRSLANLGARVPLVAFGDESKANAEQLRRVEATRRIVNPFALVWPESFDTQTLFEEQEEVCQLSNGLTIDDAIEIVRKLPTIPPAPEVLTAEWYDRVVQWSPEFIDVIWSTFADFRLFEVIEVPLG